LEVSTWFQLIELGALFIVDMGTLILWDSWIKRAICWAFRLDWHCLLVNLPSRKVYQYDPEMGMPASNCENRVAKSYNLIDTVRVSLLFLLVHHGSRT